MEGSSPPPRKKMTQEERLDAADEAALEGDLSAQRGDYEKALRSYAVALENCPANADLWAFTAFTLEGGLHREEEARVAWKRAQELDPAIRDAFSRQPAEIQKQMHKKMVGSCRSTLRDLAEEDSADPTH
jgi:tetratricopeptide (TPR) repeat protein